MVKYFSTTCRSIFNLFLCLHKLIIDVKSLQFSVSITCRTELTGSVIIILNCRIAAIALQPRSRGYLTLRSVDPAEPPILHANYFSNEHELNVLVDGARIAFKLANTTVS